MSTTKTIAPTVTKKARSGRPKKFVSLDGLMTVEEWAAMPDIKPRFELIDGILVQKPMTKPRHSKAVGELLIELAIWGRPDGWQFFPEGTGVYINPHTGFVPNVVGFRPEQTLDPDESIGATPFIVAEVLSQRTAKKDRTTKMRGYGSVSVPLYLIIDPEAHTLEIYRIENNAYGAPEVLSGADVWQPAELPGLRLELARLWM